MLTSSVHHGCTNINNQMTIFYVGTGRPYWLWKKEPNHPFFVSVRTISLVKKLKPATRNWACDSGGFTELKMNGTWKTTPEWYVDELRRITNKIGNLDFASQQDWMCEPHMLENTGFDVEKHQRLTCENFCRLQELGPELPIIPVLQGWYPDEYRRHVEMFAEYGVDLREQPTVGVGSVCRRTKFKGMTELFYDLHSYGLKMHGFGLKKDAFVKFGECLQSSDSMAWVTWGRFEGNRGNKLCGIDHPAATCTNCYEWSQIWADSVVGKYELLGLNTLNK